MTATKHRNLYEITWKDHNTHNNRWHTLKNIEEETSPSICYSVGAVVLETKDMISLIHTYCDEGAMMPGINILKNCIIKKRKLKI